MTEFYGSDAGAITNRNGSQPGTNELEAQANNMLRQNRPGLGQYLNTVAQGRPANGGYQKGIMDYSVPTPAANASLAVPDLYGIVELKAGLGASIQVPSNVDAYKLFDATVMRHGRISWQNKDAPVWNDLDYPGQGGRGTIDPRSGNLVFMINCPSKAPQYGMRLDTITVTRGQNPDGVLEAKMVSTYPDAHLSIAPIAKYSGGIQMVRIVESPAPAPQQQNADAIGSVMPGTPVYNGGMEQTSMNGNMRTDANPNYAGDQNSADSDLRRENEALKQQNQQLRQEKGGHPIIEGVAAFGLGMALQAGRQMLNNRGGYGYYNGYGHMPIGNGGIPFLNNNNVRIPFLNNRRYRHR